MLKPFLPHFRCEDKLLGLLECYQSYFYSKFVSIRLVIETRQEQTDAVSAQSPTNAVSQKITTGAQYRNEQ